MDQTRSRNGHDYREIEIGHHARVHLGDQIGVTINNKVAARTDYSGHYAYNALLPVSTYVERPTLYEKLQAQLHSPALKEKQRPCVVVVHGAGGTGKSQLVLNYIQQRRRDYTAVFWIDSATKATVERDFLQIYRLLYELHDHAGSGTIRVEDAVPAVKRWFYGRQKRCLFVFESADNVDHGQEPTYVDLRYFLPDDPFIDIVITTRNASTRKMSEQEGVEVAEMETKEAVRLFQKQAEMTAGASEAEVTVIVQELGCLALAVTLAGSYVATIPSLKANISQYIPEYRKRREKLLSQKPEWLVHQYGASLLTTWEASFEAVKRRSARACDIFVSLFAEEGEENITTSMIVLFPSQEVTLHDVEGFFSLLRTYSLTKFDSGLGSYSMHRLIHRWAQDRLSSKEQNRYKLLSILVLGKALGRGRHHTPTMRVRLLPHLMSNFDILSKCFNLSKSEAGSVFRYLGEVANFLDSAGQWNNSISIRRFIFERYCGIFGTEHPNTVSAMNNLANTLGSLGEMQEALLIQREVVEKRRRILREEHPDVLLVKTNLGIILRKLGAVQEAVLIQQEVVKKSKQILGNEHPDTIAAMNNLANILGDIGEIHEALLLQREVVETSKQILGDEHLDTIMALNNLANTLGRLGEIHEALLIQREVVEKSKQKLGEEHPYTILALNNLAVTLRKTGEIQEALSIQREVVEKRRRILGEEHPDTILATTHLRKITDQIKKSQ